MRVGQRRTRGEVRYSLKESSGVGLVSGPPSFWRHSGLPTAVGLFLVFFLAPITKFANPHGSASITIEAVSHRALIGAAMRDPHE